MNVRKIYHTILGYTILIINTAIVWFLVCLLGLIPKRKGQGAIDWIVRFWCRSFLYACGVTFEFRGLEKIKNNETYIIMSNHRSHMDGPILISGLPFGFSIIIKKELALIPFFGWALYLAGSVPVIRHDPNQSHRKISESATIVKNGRSVLFFPEGTRSKSDEFLPFKKGGIIMAIEAQVKVLPIAISGTHSILPKGKLSPEPGHAIVEICELIETKGFTYENRDELLKKVEQAIKSKYKQGKIVKEL